MLGGRQRRALAHRCNRRNAGCLDRRTEAREERDDDAGEDADDDRPGGDDGPSCGELDAECLEERIEALRKTQSEHQPENGRDDSDDECFEHHHPENLPSRTPDRPQRGELAQHAARW